jgi:RecJ-like exonuclease
MEGVGGKKEVDVKVKPCHECSGTGSLEDCSDGPNRTCYDTCHRCNGTGQIEVPTVRVRIGGNGREPYLARVQAWQASVPNDPVHEISVDAYNRYRRLVEEYGQLMVEISRLERGEKTAYWG